MNYTETVQWMFLQLPIYQSIGMNAHTKKMDNSWAFAAYLDHPQEKFKSIHIGGTNGKGSTSSMIAAILQEAGYKVGLYTSPHLKDYRERIKINGIPISEQFVVDFVEKHQSFMVAQKLSFFEMTVGLAFDYFAKEHVDVAVIEVGLGGRLDSTNIITPLVSVITNIGKDHQAILGETIEEIATEKAGIIKANVPAVIGVSDPQTEDVFRKKANEVETTIVFADTVKFDENYTSDLKGNYQKHNIQTARVAVELLKKHFNITEQHIQTALQKVVALTGLLGRWHQLNERPLIIADTAHNEHGLKEVIPQILEQIYEKLYIVIGMVNDKDVDKIIDLFPQDAIYLVSKPNVPRGLEAQILYHKLKEKGREVHAFESIAQALEIAKKYATVNDMIYVGGSTFVVAEIV
ncbi:folylpolyglutamate synthase/dihydrofolate synthase family protein [Capnocytophaga sp. ARDL2]|uniref:bifunctional folylpolyglutamate synthase/dihydrofolate synthase n=1 Tax=Capnocytophaga sp. ARDL2 TaxID=3238809 RepID=UPI003558D44C